MGVLNGTLCALCWRPVMGDVHYQQTAFEVTRSLCSGCFTLFYPALPPEVPQDSQIVRIDAKALFKGKAG